MNCAYQFNVIPAFGADYKSAKAVQQGWDEGKDFQIVNLFGGDYGRYMNKDDAPKGAYVTIRYNKNRSVTVIKVV